MYLEKKLIWQKIRQRENVALLSRCRPFAEHTIGNKIAFRCQTTNSSRSSKKRGWDKTEIRKGGGEENNFPPLPRIASLLSLRGVRVARGGEYKIVRECRIAVLSSLKLKLVRGQAVMLRTDGVALLLDCGDRSQHSDDSRETGGLSLNLLVTPWNIYTHSVSCMKSPGNVIPRINIRELKLIIIRDRCARARARARSPMKYFEAVKYYARIYNITLVKPIFFFNDPLKNHRQRDLRALNFR